MNRRVSLVIVTLAAAGAAFGVTQWIRHMRCPDENAWLQQEFSLNAAQIAAIKKIRAEYEPTCATHCEKMTAARARLARFGNPPDTKAPGYASAKVEFDALAAECARATRQHVEAIAAQMDPEHARRYLELVGPKISHSPTVSLPDNQ